ncbi:MAG: hypothetical protein AB1502_17260 [Thermodesulfobacteriota bacterium]
MRDFKPNILILLLAIMLLLAMGAGQPWTSPVPLAFGREEGKKPEARKDARMETHAPTAGTNSGPSNMPYTGLAEKNIFSPERKEFPIFSTPEPTRKPQARPQVVLYGVTIAGDYQSASIVQLGRALRKGEREMLTLKVGERIGEYKLVKIMPDRITLETEGDTFEILLYDPAKPKQRTTVKTESKPVSITSTLPGPAAAPSIEATKTDVTRTPVPRQERVVTPPVATPGVPSTITPGAPQVPTPVTPTTPHANFLRRGGRITPLTTETPAPQTPTKP